MFSDEMETLLANHMTRYIDFYEEAAYPVTVYKANRVTNTVEPIEVLQYATTLKGTRLLYFMFEGKETVANIFAFNLTKEEAEQELRVPDISH